MEVFSLDEDLISDFEVQGQQAMFVCLDLVSDLRFSNVGMEVGVEFVEVDCVILSACRGEILFRMD